MDFHAHAFPEAFLRKMHEYYPGAVVLRQDAHGHLIGVSGASRGRPGIMVNASTTWMPAGSTS